MHVQFLGKNRKECPNIFGNFGSYMSNADTSENYVILKTVS